MEFKEALRGLREEEGLTQQQLARKLGVSLSVVNKWENGKKLPSFEYIRIIAKYFKVSADYLLDL